MSEFWPWLALAGLGAFHGLNPAMGWLFAVALGLHRRVAPWCLGPLPIALGHALAILLVALAVVLLGIVVDQRLLRIGAGAVLIGWAVYHMLYGSRHRVRFGMQVGMLGLALFVSDGERARRRADAGAGADPFVLAASPAGELSAAGSAPIALAAVGVHTLAMLATTGAVAVTVYEWLGVAFLRRGWINLDRIWTVALVATGLILLLM